MNEDKIIEQILKNREDIFEIKEMMIDVTTKGDLVEIKDTLDTLVGMYKRGEDERVC